MSKDVRRALELTFWTETADIPDSWLVDKRDLCADFDADCYTIEDKVKCAAYMPECGYCPFRKKKEIGDE